MSFQSSKFHLFPIKSPLIVQKANTMNIFSKKLNTKGLSAKALPLFLIEPKLIVRSFNYLSQLLLKQWNGIWRLMFKKWILVNFFIINEINWISDLLYMILFLSWIIYIYIYIWIFVLFKLTAEALKES